MLSYEMLDLKVVCPYLWYCASPYRAMTRVNPALKDVIHSGNNTSGFKTSRRSVKMILLTEKFLLPKVYPN